MSKKKYLMAAVALICMTLTFVMSSCNKENDERNNVISYSASGEINPKDTSIADLTTMTAAGEYNTVIGQIVPLGNTENKDAEVIAACDNLYQKHKQKNLNWKGTITITKSVGLIDKTTTTLKTYTFE